jgi:hypothetical protein
MPAPTADERTAAVRVMAGSINPSEVKNVAGAMKQTTLPRHNGRLAGVPAWHCGRGDKPTQVFSTSLTAATS